ncbi:MAG: hypothetical protein WA660_15480, partial [Candidatus Acidiferrales bacterium]
GRGYTNFDKIAGGRLQKVGCSEVILAGDALFRLQFALSLGSSGCRAVKNFAVATKGKGRNVRAR